jgi:hypothetical protein
MTDRLDFADFSGIKNKGRMMTNHHSSAYCAFVAWCAAYASSDLSLLYNPDSFRSSTDERL